MVFRAVATMPVTPSTVHLNFLNGERHVEIRFVMSFRARLNKPTNKCLQK